MGQASELAQLLRSSAVDAERMLSVTDHPEMAKLAKQVNEKLRRALTALQPRASA
jgi:hypothetical protein